MRLTYLVVLCAVGLTSMPATASHLVTGNGFGFAVVDPQSAALTRFYAHPYSFVRPDPLKPLGEGIETANFIQRLGWSGGNHAQMSSANYEQDSHVIHAHGSDGEGFFFMPFGLNENALIVDWEPAANDSSGSFAVQWSHKVISQNAVRGPDGEMYLLRFEGVPEELLLVPLGPSRGGAADAQQVLSRSNSWALISLENSGDGERAVSQLRYAHRTANNLHAWRAGLSAKALARREMNELERWRITPAVHFKSEAERHLWRQSEVMLRMAQGREPNRAGRDGSGRYGNGLIVACLPDGVFFTPWVRDMAYATVALARTGHKAEARAALLAYFNARPTGKMRAETAGADYQVSVVRYFGNGEEEPFFTEEGATNIEYDDWGLVLWVLGEYERLYSDRDLLTTATNRGPLYESARDFVMGPLVKNLEAYSSGKIVAADTSIWEEHQKDKKHFAWSTALGIVGLREFAEVAQAAGDLLTQTEALRQAALLEEGFHAAFIRDGELHGTLEPGEKNDIDGALMEIINLGVVRDPVLMRDTVERMEKLKVASGGYKRVRSNYTDPAIYEYWYEKEEFLFVDFSLAEVNRRLGRKVEADAMLGRIVTKAAADHNILPEMYVAVPSKLFPGQIGDPTGALPMVGYGAGEYILHLMEREALEKRE